MKRILLVLILLAVVIVSSGCDITQTQIEAIAGGVTWLVSPDGLSYHGSRYFAGYWWEIEYVAGQGVTAFGKSNWNDVNGIRILKLKEFYTAIPWSYVPVMVRSELIAYVMAVVPIFPIAMFDILLFPVLPDMPQLTVTEIPT